MAIIESLNKHPNVLSAFIDYLRNRKINANDLFTKYPVSYQYILIAEFFQIFCNLSVLLTKYEICIIHMSFEKNICMRRQIIPTPRPTLEQCYEIAIIMLCSVFNDPLNAAIIEEKDIVKLISKMYNEKIKTINK